MIGEIKTHNDEGKPVRTFTVVTQQRIEYYADVIDSMIADKLYRYAEKYGHFPTAKSIRELNREMIRQVVISRNLDAAMALKLEERFLLKG